MLYTLAAGIGIVAGLRALTPLAAISLAAWCGWISLAGSWLSFLASPWAAAILTLLAFGELVADKLPSTPSRKALHQYGTRIVIGAVCGAAIAVAGAFSPWIGAILGAVGAVIGTEAGAAGRRRLAAMFGRDLPAALLEDLIAVGAALAIVAAFA